MTPRPERRKRGAIDEIVYAALLDSNAPIGAYGLIRRLDPGFGTIAAPLMFRALNRLIAARRVARIESLSGYVATGAGPGIDLICSTCSGWQRVCDNAVHRRLHDACLALGFKPARAIIELNGVCNDCAVTGRRADTESVSRSQRHDVTSLAYLGGES